MFLVAVVWLLSLLGGVRPTENESDVVICGLVYESINFVGSSASLVVEKGDSVLLPSMYIGSLVVFPDCSVDLTDSMQNTVTFTEGTYTANDLGDFGSTDVFEIMVSQLSNSGTSPDDILCAIVLSPTALLLSPTGFEVIVKNKGTREFKGHDLIQSVGSRIDTLIVQENCLVEVGNVVSWDDDILTELTNGVYTQADFDADAFILRASHIGDISDSCLLFGSVNQVVSFDDGHYAFLGKGEFVAFNSDLFQVNVELDEGCVAVEGVTCVTAVAVHDKREDSTRIYTANGGETEREVIYSYGVDSPTLKFSDVYYNAESDVEIFRVDVQFGSQGPVVSITALPSAFPATGLCGSFTKISDTNSYTKRDGSVSVGDSHEKMAEDFASSWQVLTRKDTLFHSDVQESDFVIFTQPDFTPADYTTLLQSDTLPAQCEQFSAMEWLATSCAWDVAFGLQNSQMYDDIIFDACMDFCEGGGLRFKISEEMCGRSCEEGLLDLHDVYNGDNTPKYTLKETSPFDAVFSADLGGQYVVENGQFDEDNNQRCGQLSNTVTVNLQCEQEFSIEIPEEIVVHVSQGGTQSVHLPVPTSNGPDISIISWKITGLSKSVLFKSIPNDDYWENMSENLDEMLTVVTRDELFDVLFEEYNLQALIDFAETGIEPTQEVRDKIEQLNDFLRINDLLGKVSTYSDPWDGLALFVEPFVQQSFDEIVHPLLQGNQMKTARITTNVPGIYVVEVAATDGCSISKDEIRIVVECAECEQILTIDQTMDLTDSFIHEINGNETIEQAPGVIEPSFMLPKVFDYYPIHFNSRAFTTADSQPFGLEYRWSIATERNFEKITHEDYDAFNMLDVVQERLPANYSDSGNSTTITERTESSLLRVHHTASITNVNEVPSELFHAGKQEYSKTIITEFQEWELQQYHSEEVIESCQLRLVHTGDTSREIQIKLLDGDFSSFRCVGDYSAVVDTFNGCHKERSSYDFNVRCGMPPVAYIKCVPSLEFDYIVSRFPSIEVDASMSYQQDGADLIFKWESIDGPSDQVRWGRSRKLQGGEGEIEKLQLPQSAGIYTIQVTVSDGCSETTATTELEGICFPPPRLQLSGYPLSDVIEVETLRFSGTASLLKDFSAAASQWDAPVATLAYTWELVTVPIDEELEELMAGSRLEGRQERAFQPSNTNLRMDFYLGGIWRIQLSGADGCETSQVDIVVPIECRTTLQANPGEDFTVNLDANGGRVYLRNSATIWNSEDNLNMASYSFQYEWIWVSWPESLDSPPSLQDNRVLIVDTTERDIFDPINSRDGQFTLVAEEFRDGNYMPKSNNPSDEQDATSFAPDVVGEYVLKLVVTDGCSVDATRDEPGPGELGHLVVTVDCLNLQKPTAFVPESHDLNRFTPLEMNGNDPHFFPDLLGISYLWSITSAPEGSICYENFDSEECDVINAARTTVAAFWPDAIGDWTVTFTLDSDICGQRSIDSPIEVLCERPKVEIVDLFITGNTEWHDGKFDLLSLSGLHGPSDLDFEREVDYFWTVSSAPEGSTYVPECSPENPCREETVEVVESVQITQFGNRTENEVLTVTTTNTVVEYYSFAQLADNTEEASYNDVDTFRACFQPDIPGEYVFELRVVMDCGETTETVSTVVSCNTPPVADAGEDFEIGLSANNFDEFGYVYLDGTGSYDVDELDRVTYFWNWVPSDDWTDETFLTLPTLYNADTPTPKFLATKSGVYELSLTVTDGCSTSEDFVNVVVTCDMGDVVPLDTVLNVNVAPGMTASSAKVSLESMFDETCTDYKIWEVVDYIS